jgi:predicted lipid-binding transport protein (Tim44 family)
MLFVPIGAIFNGLDRKIVTSKSIPNEGMRLSIRNSVFGGLIAGLSTGLIIVLASEILFSGMLSQIIFVLSNGRIPVDALWIHVLVVGLFIGLIAVFWYGGLDVIQHYILRLILVIHRHTPANYARFLDYAVDRIFLQKVGGGYRFIHRLLLEHFAEMSETKKP